MSARQPLSLFAGYGIELEFMIVRNGDLSVLPISDEILREVSGAYVSETEQGKLAWSNELVLHVIELKTNGPASTLAGLADAFTADVRRINGLLEPMGGRLMPTAMHPWMDPHTETRLWPHEYNPIYEALDRIFSCKGHGWSNLQSAHINLPFADDDEFARLHAAIRLLLPILPALAASSPLIEGRATGLLDNRLEAYRVNCRRIPSVTGRVIPETVTSHDDYQARILQPMYHDIAPYDPDHVLQYEWLNARGAIARFDRNTIEIRVLDVQECAQADLAIAAAIIALLKAVVAERWEALATQQAHSTEALERIFLATLAEGDAALIDDPAYLRTFGFAQRERCSARELWQHLVTEVPPAAGTPVKPLHVILEQGCLARRILAATGAEAPRARCAEVYAELCRCLARGEMFVPA